MPDWSRETISFYEITHANLKALMNRFDTKTEEFYRLAMALRLVEVEMRLDGYEDEWKNMTDT